MFLKFLGWFRLYYRYIPGEAEFPCMWIVETREASVMQQKLQRFLALISFLLISGNTIVPWICFRSCFIGKQEDPSLNSLPASNSNHRRLFGWRSDSTAAPPQEVGTLLPPSLHCFACLVGIFPSINTRLPRPTAILHRAVACFIRGERGR